MLSALAEGLLDLVAPRRCPGCDLRHDWGGRGFCEACRPLLEPLMGPAAYAYGGPLAEGVRRLKYQGRTDLVEPLSALLVERAVHHRGKVDVVVAIPLHRERLKTRGFDQAALLAAPVARALGVPLARQRLLRVRHTATQAGLKEAGRADNVRGAFVARRDSNARRILLVDDVRTTGATMQSAAGALHRAGASEVRLLALAGVV